MPISAHWISMSRCWPPWHVYNGRHPVRDPRVNSLPSIQLAQDATDSQWATDVRANGENMKCTTPSYHQRLTLLFSGQHHARCWNICHATSRSRRCRRSRLKVHEASNMRVVDAKVTPMQLTGHPTAPILAVAESYELD